MADRFNADEYIDVAQRIAEFYAKYPDGRLVSRNWKLVQTAETDWVVVEAEAYRTPDDPHPGVGLAWERVPGKTNFTRDSELSNAETSAWGRAIVALGFETKHLASANEVRNRQGGDDYAPPSPQTRQQRPPSAPQGQSGVHIPSLFDGLNQRGIRLDVVSNLIGQPLAKGTGERPWSGVAAAIEKWAVDQHWPGDPLEAVWMALDGEEVLG